MICECRLCGHRYAGILTTGAATFAAKVSDAASPLVSVAVTLTIRFCMVTGAVPLNVLLVGSKVSQPGSAFPFDWVAVYRNVCACGSVNVFAGSAKKTGYALLPDLLRRLGCQCRLFPGSWR